MRKSEKVILLNFNEINERNMEFSTHVELNKLITALSSNKEYHTPSQKKVLVKYKTKKER